MIKLFLLPSWTSSQEQCEIWKKMNCFKNIELVSSEPCDFFVVINHTNYNVDKKKTIFLNMEPFLISHFFLDSQIVIFPPQKLNTLEWHLSFSYDFLQNSNFYEIKKNNISAILSNKYFDEGHKKRIDLCKFIEKQNEFEIDVFGSNYFNWKKYKGVLPYHQKENGLIKYKYHINMENHSIPNYLTEKLIDGILSECLVFYWGCPNVLDYLPENSFIILDSDKIEKNYETIKFHIENNSYELYRPKILEAKNKILNELQFFPRINNIIQSLHSISNI